MKDKPRTMVNIIGKAQIMTLIALRCAGADNEKFLRYCQMIALATRAMIIKNITR